MTELGNGLHAADHHEDAMSVQEAEISLLRRVGAPEDNILAAQSNLALSYRRLGRFEEALRMQREVYSGSLRLEGEECPKTLVTALNYASSLVHLGGFEEARTLLRKEMPVARRILGESNELTLQMRWNYARALYLNAGATLDELREAVETLVDIERTARRVLGGAHPTTTGIERELQNARAALRARERSGDSA